jgi:hypothetical protein
LLNREISAETGPEVWLEATAIRFAFAPNCRLSQVVAEAPDGCRLTVVAGEVAIAAGAIESTRLLLLANHAAGDRLFAPDDVLGRYFHDNLSVRVAEIEPTARTRSTASPASASRAEACATCGSSRARPRDSARESRRALRMSPSPTGRAAGSTRCAISSA